MKNVVDSSQSFLLESVHFADKINLRQLPVELASRSKTEATVGLGPAGYAFVFSFGAIVFFNVPADVQRDFLRKLQGGITPVEDPSTDDFLVTFHPEARERVLFDRAIVQEISDDRLRLVARALAQSTALEAYERTVEAILERSAQMTEAMKLGGRVPGREQDLVRFIGQALSVRRDILTSLAVLDAPDITWEDPGLDRIYTELRANFEFDIRLTTMEKKIQLVVDSAEILVDLVKSRREELLEVVIIFLIVLEILTPFLLYKPV